MARPRAGDWLEDEIENWRAAGVQVVVSLLEPSEEAELGLQAEADACRSRGIEFIRFPIADRGVPSDRKAALELAQTLGRSEQAIAIHCRAGIGRSSLMAALVLIHRGVTPDTAFGLIQAARGVAVPDTDQQLDWVSRFAG
jgi:protein-tyrosine phosphatase